MPIAPGARLGAYEIVGPLGAGGMGEVWKARDTRLDRIVAIKVLGGELATSAESRLRFELEARAISQLSHPHICALYDIGSDGDAIYLVMEHLEGETLAQRLVRGRLPIPEVLAHGTEIADALSAAHRRGILHRDLKPANVMLTRNGVKLLDFGLAKTTPVAGPTTQMSVAPTVPSLTAAGHVMGTLHYMAPEQLAGHDAGPRTDLFALGAVLHEMATGERAFTGPSQAAVIGAVLRDEPPPITTMVPDATPALERLVRACLTKDPEQRWESASDVAQELRWIAGGASGEGARAVRRGLAGREALAWGIAILAAVIGIVTGLLFAGDRVVENPTRFAIRPPPGQTLFGAVALTPDGRRLAVLMRDEAGKTSIGVRKLDDLELRVLPGTDEARGMIWSPDGQELAFFARGELDRLPAEGGPVERICASGGAFAGSWSPQGTILFVPGFGSPVVAVPASGGTPTPVTRLDTAHGERAHSDPAFLPDGRHFVFAARNVDPEKTSVMLGSLDSSRPRALFHADTSALVADLGYLLFGRDGSIFAWRFDASRLRLVGEPAPVVEGVRSLREDNHLVAATGGNRLAYLQWRNRRRLVWVDRKGRELGVVGEEAPYADVRVSPDGRHLAVTRRDPSHGQNQDAWVLDVARGTSARVSSEPTEELDPAWFPDGRSIAYVSDRAGFYDLAARSTSGGDERILLRSHEDKVTPEISPDGLHMIYAAADRGRFVRFLLPLAGGPPARLTRDLRFSEQHPTFSPDGRWTAFDSDESGQREVYVEPFPTGPKQQVSLGGGQIPVWSRNGGEIFYVGGNAMLMAVELRRNGGRLEARNPQPLFPLELGTGGELPWHRHPFDVSADGERFVVIRGLSAEPEAAVVVTNWPATLRAGR